MKLSIGPVFNKAGTSITQWLLRQFLMYQSFIFGSIGISLSFSSSRCILPIFFPDRNHPSLRQKMRTDGLQRYSSQLRWRTCIQISLCPVSEVTDGTDGTFQLTQIIHIYIIVIVNCTWLRYDHHKSFCLVSTPICIE